MGEVINDRTIKLDFRIVDFDFHPDEITKDLGVTPSETWQSGNLVMPNSKSQLRYKTNGWSIDSGIIDNGDLAQHFLILIDKLSALEVKLNNYCKKYYGEFSCAIYLYDNSQVPSIHLDKSIINFINRINAEVDFDIYTFGSLDDSL